MRATAIAVLLFVAGCSTRLPVPVVQTWTAVLHDAAGERVLAVAPVNVIHPFLTWTVACRSSGVMAVRLAPCETRRVFRFHSVDEKLRTATYREIDQER